MVYLVNQREGHAQPVCNCSCSFGATGIRTDNDSLLVVRDVVLDILFQQRAPIEVVDGNVEEALVLRIVQVHGDDMVCTGASQEICNKGAGLRNPLLVTGSGLKTIFRGLAGRGACFLVVWGSGGGRRRSAVLVLMGAVGERGDGRVSIAGRDVAVGLGRVHRVAAFRGAISVMRVARGSQTVSG